MFHRLTSKQLLGIVSAVYFCMSLYLYNKYGVKIMNDSPRYLSYTENLSGGFYFDPLNFWYISYVFFIAFIKLFSENHAIIILAQYILGFVATFSIFGVTKRLTNNLKLAFLSALIFIFFPDNLNWHSYVLTESFYCSILSITFYLLIKASQEKRTLDYIIATFFILISFFSKPTSPALIIALAFPIVWQWLRSPPQRVWKFASLVVAGVVLVFLANTMISSHRVMLIYENGDIIFAMHEFPTHPHHDWMTIEVPKDLYKPPVDQPLLQQMGSFVISNPLYFSKLFFGKMIMYVSHIRTYWSWPHNIAMMTMLWPLYFFSLKAIRRRLVARYFSIASIVYFVTHTMVVSGTWADWDGRFFVPLIPLVVVLGTIGLGDFLIMKRKIKTIN